MRANDKLIHFLNQVTNEMTTRKLAEECLKKIEEVNSMTWTVSTVSDCDTYSTASSNVWTGLRTFGEMCEEYNVYSKEKTDQKEIEQKERVDNIMNKYGLI